MKSEEKTNVMRLLSQKKIEYKAIYYSSEYTEGTAIADILNEPHERVFKTLVTETQNHSHYVFVIPVEKTLDLKAAAKAVGEKSVSMLKQKDLLPLTGYVHGGCSPVGMKKAFKTVFDSTAKDFQKIYVSAGKLGCQIEVSPILLCEYVGGFFENLTVL